MKTVLKRNVGTFAAVIIALAAVIGFSFVACDSGNGGGDSGGGKWGNPPTALVGTWLSMGGVSPGLVINANGTGTVIDDPVDSWKVKGSELKMNYSGVESIVKWSVSGNTLTLSYPSDTSTIGIGNMLITLSPLTKSSTSGGGGDVDKTKPEKLANKATHSQAVEKLDAIIAYSGTPAATKQQAQELKSGITTPGFETTWVSTASTYITLINNMIDEIPGGGGGGTDPGPGENPNQPSDKMYTITYIANGGHVYPDTQTVRRGEWITPPEIYRDGYEFDGWNTEPNGNGTTYKSGSAFTITRNTTLYAMWNEVQTAAKPTTNPPAGAVAGAITVTLETATPAAEIWYTTNGSAPAKNGVGSSKYTKPFAVTPPVTIKAVAVKDGMNNSAVLEAAYTKDNGQQQTPTIPNIEFAKIPEKWTQDYYGGEVSSAIGSSLMQLAGQSQALSQLPTDKWPSNLKETWDIVQPDIAFMCQTRADVNSIKRTVSATINELIGEMTSSMSSADATTFKAQANAYRQANALNQREYVGFYENGYQVNPAAKPAQEAALLAQINGLGINVTSVKDAIPLLKTALKNAPLQAEVKQQMDSILQQWEDFAQFDGWTQDLDDIGYQGRTPDRSQQQQTRASIQAANGLVL